MVYLITGKAGAGKTTYARRLAEELDADGRKVMVIDGDEYRKEHDNNDYTDEGRLKNLLGAAELASSIEAQGTIVIMAFISPKRVWRDRMREYWVRSLVIYIPGGILWEGTEYEKPDEYELYKRPHLDELSIQLKGSSIQYTKEQKGIKDGTDNSIRS